MLRRSFLATLPALAISSRAAAVDGHATTDNKRALSANGRVRMAAPTIWTDASAPELSISTRLGTHGTRILSLAPTKPVDLPASAAFGLRFATLPGFRHGVASWRYAPWKAWTKPMAMRHAADLESDDIQFAYWQYDDDTYGVALALGGGGFRATIGTHDGAFATVCRALAPARTDRPMPQLAIGFGKELYATISAVFGDALTALGRADNLRRKKTLPDSLTWLGWNTWNASDNGKNLAAQWVLDQVDIMRKAGAPVRTVVLDDGHFAQRDSALQSQQPDRQKFPGGFKPVVDALLNEHGLKHVGLWHAFNALWNGIDPGSELGRGLSGKLFTWTQASSVTDATAKRVSYSFLKPDPALLDSYFDGYHSDLKAAGFTLLKVDNQLVAERMAKDNYPVWDLATAIHNAINKGAARHFDNALINCMDMTNDTFLNFGGTAVARSVEDYFPYKPTETYDLQEGNAAAHVLQAMYNALYFGEMAFPDFDMFESTNPNAWLHAAVRAANCAPIYITDQAGKHDIKLLKALVDHEGRTLRADTPLRPLPASLFQVQQAKLFKAWSRTGDGALVLLANLADTEQVAGSFVLRELPDLPRGEYVIWAHYAKTVSPPEALKDVRFTYPRFGHELLSVAPVNHGRALIGLAEKLNGLASVRDVKNKESGLSCTARDEGTLVLWCKKSPAKVTVDGKPAPFTHENSIVRILLDQGPREYRVELHV